MDLGLPSWLSPGHRTAPRSRERNQAATWCSQDKPSPGSKRGGGRAPAQARPRARSRSGSFVLGPRPLGFGGSAAPAPPLIDSLSPLLVMEETTARKFLSVVSVLSQCEPPRLPAGPGQLLIRISALTLVLSRRGEQPDPGTPPSCARATHSASTQHSDGAEGPPSPVAVMSDSGLAPAMQAAKLQSDLCAPETRAWGLSFGYK